MKEIVQDGITFRGLPFPKDRVYVYLSTDLWSHFARKFNHSVRTRQFPFYKTLIQFIRLNPSINILFTELPEHVPFVVRGNNYIVNIDSYKEFCEKIERCTEGRAQAFFGQHIDLSSTMTDEQKQKIFSTATYDDIVAMIDNLSTEHKAEVLNKLPHRILDETSEDTKSFADHLSRAFSSTEKRRVVIASYPSVQLATLKEHRDFLKANLDKMETFIQNWIDGKIDNDGNPIILDKLALEQLKKSRCLIFGLEFINHRREGHVSQKRFDILTKIADGRNEYVLIELKSPCGSVFKVDVTPTSTGGVSTTYSLSDDVARAIPQISDYKGLLQDATETEWQELGIARGDVVKSIIFVGTRIENNKVWDQHYVRLKHTLSSSIEIMTYTDLLDKLNATIKNLEENL